MRIAVLANLKENAPAIPEIPKDQWDDLDSPSTIESIINALKSNGHTAEFFEASIRKPYNLIEKLQLFKPDLCFNIAEGHFGDSREAHIPSLLEMMSIPYTGSKVLTLALALDKPMTKRILHYHDLPTPEFQVFSNPDEPLNDDLLDGGTLKFPLFLKPSREGTGMGVAATSIITSIKDLRDRIEFLLARYNQPVLCERFIKGRELTVGVMGNLNSTAARRLNDRTAPATLPEELTFFPTLEVDTEKYDASEAGLYSNRIKTELVDTFYYTCPAKIDPVVEDMLYRYAAAVVRVTGCYDVARIDFRLDENNGNTPFILEINPLPGLNPNYSDLCLEAYAYGWTYDKLINSIVTLASERQGINYQKAIASSNSKRR